MGCTWSRHQLYAERDRLSRCPDCGGNLTVGNAVFVKNRDLGDETTRHMPARLRTVEAVPPASFEEYLKRIGAAASRIDEPLVLPTDSAARKKMPVTTGALHYFPRAIAYIAGEVSRPGNEKHNPGEPLHWSKEKSTDHADCIGRHLLELGKRDPVTGTRESGYLAWRALANLEIELEAAEKRGEKW